MEITQILKDATIIIITLWFMHYNVFLAVFKTVLRIFFHKRKYSCTPRLSAELSAIILQIDLQMIIKYMRRLVIVEGQGF